MKMQCTLIQFLLCVTYFQNLHFGTSYVVISKTFKPKYVTLNKNHTKVRCMFMHPQMFEMFNSEVPKWRFWKYITWNRIQIKVRWIFMQFCLLCNMAYEENNLFSSYPSIFIIRFVGPISILLTSHKFYRQSHLCISLHCIRLSKSVKIAI